MIPPRCGAESPRCGAGRCRRGMGPPGSGFGAETGGPGNVDGTPLASACGTGTPQCGLGSPRDWGEGLGPLGTGMGSRMWGWDPLRIKMWGWDPPGVGLWGWDPLSVGLGPPSGVGPPQCRAGVPREGLAATVVALGTRTGSGCRAGTSHGGTEDTPGWGCVVWGGSPGRGRRCHPRMLALSPWRWHRARRRLALPVSPGATRPWRGVGDTGGGEDTNGGDPDGLGGDPPAPAGGPGAPRRWPRTEVRQRQRCMSPVFPPWGGEGPGLTPSVPPDVRFVTEESFDFGVLSPSDRYGVLGTGHCIAGDRGNRMGHGGGGEMAPHCHCPKGRVTPWMGV